MGFWGLINHQILSSVWSVNLNTDQIVIDEKRVFSMSCGKYGLKCHINPSYSKTHTHTKTLIQSKWWSAHLPQLLTIFPIIPISCLLKGLLLIILNFLLLLYILLFSKCCLIFWAQVLVGWCRSGFSQIISVCLYTHTHTHIYIYIYIQCTWADISYDNV